ncbi:nucleotide-binding oligomerization domain-containing protein 2 isoform X2 [Larimichthys crocea]|uniref:nucleotide-binding oligomerization domain-containing protein 2 isoform X2 n=1 Tax=Larimichthys crocea TaxID=215358 RepID=UPI00054B3BE0|nr:nucleotide-binding oligomerization domain-containing protein 2 isoform X2 [Larimichthys crocea]
MFAQEFVLKQRTEILHALCSSGSTEHLERVLDILLAQGELIWEDYQNIQVPDRALYTKARQLLDLVYTKGVDTCELFLAALKQVLPESQIVGLSFAGCNSNLEEKEEYQSTSTHTLLTQRPSLVSKLLGRIHGALEALVISGHFTSADCDEVRLPVYTPSQQARRLLDHVRPKGELAAKVVLQYIQQKQETGSALNPEKLTPPKEFLKYQKKLSSSVSAQSCFLSTYGGTSHMSLDDIYTEGQLELAQYCADVHGPLGLEDIVGTVGTVNEEADTVLVSGEAGSGKTTLLQRLHLLWARGVALQQFLLLFPFSCRRLNSEHRELSVKELLFQHCCWPDRDQEEIFQFILDHPHLVLFTFDGLDELKQSFSDEKRLCCPTQPAPVHILLFNFIQGSLMKGVRKVVTSRPEAVGPMLKTHLCKEVLLKGFSPSGIDCFVRKHHSDNTVATKVLESLQTNTALLGLCHSPVLCWIVSQCHKELLGCGEGSPQTITDVYLMILQHFFQHQSSLKSTVGLGWFQDHLKTVLHLGQLAFEGMKNTCYIFSGTDLETCGVTENDIYMGFLIQSKDLSSNHGKHYEFLHVTMQCFFAALYIVLSNNMDHSTISKLFEVKDMWETDLTSSCFRACLPSTYQQDCSLQGDATAAETSNLQITATFVSGLLSKRHQSLWLQCCPSAVMEKKIRQVGKCLSKGMQKHFKSIPQPVEGEKKSMHAMPGFVWLIKCIYEMQESRIAKDAMSKLEVDHLKLTYCNIGPVECTALAYVLQHLRNPVGLQLDNNSVGDVGVEQLLPCMHICNSLYLRNNNITDEGIRKLIAKGIQCENFRKIALFNNKLTDACTQHISQLLRTKDDFLSLRLGNNNITAEGAKQLAEGLKFNHSLQYLGLWGNKIGDTGAEALAKALESSKTLVWLSLVGNGVGNAGASALANIIKNSPTLEELWLTENCITRTGVERLIEALKHNIHVKSIWLRNNDLSLEEVEEMTQRESRLVF